MDSCVWGGCSFPLHDISEGKFGMGNQVMVSTNTLLLLPLPIQYSVPGSSSDPFPNMLLIFLRRILHATSNLLKKSFSLSPSFPYGLNTAIHFQALLQPLLVSQGSSWFFPSSGSPGLLGSQSVLGVLPPFGLHATQGMAATGPPLQLQPLGWFMTIHFCSFGYYTNIPTN